LSVVRVKICGLTRREDVGWAVDAGADALGFVFTPVSRRVLDPGQAATLVSGVPAFVCRVGLFMNQDSQTVSRVLKRVPLSLLQFHGSEDAGFCRQFGLPYIKAVSVVSAESVRRAETDFADAAALLLDSHPEGGAGGTGVSFDWSLVPSTRLPLILAGGLTPGSVREAVERTRPWAVDVSSGVEDAPGIKNQALMREFIKEAKSEH
jgi:phosphoribosylanthranilate isomerase